MNDADRHLLTVFSAALERDPDGERSAYLDEACAGASDLRDRVEALLRAHGQAGRFLDPAEAATVNPSGHAPAEPAGRTTPHDVPSEAAGTTIGPYRLVQIIGEGGMGTVYLAEQMAPVKRVVALKIIKPGMDTGQVVARFEAERQALALMDHPSIAKVLDAGSTAAGRPFFVMELVRGVPITEYCDTVHLTPKERLELFIPVCEAVQHAHQKGVIHRDLKPSNVLVAMQDGRPVPKVIDFGIAKATEQKLTERSLFTQHGAVIGTLEYMSPEQAEMSAMGVDTRTDVYALGVMLYELLTGSTPLERARLRQAAYVEILKRIREEEPPKPSTRLSESGESLPSVAALRRTEPSRLTKLVRGDLDWIVMKAIEKDRTRRYETASGFARDIRRHLDGDPVEACPPSVRYRLGKFARKHRAALAAAAAFALLLVAATAISVGLAVWADHERSRAVKAELSAKEQQARATNREKIAIDAVRRFGDIIVNETELKNTPALDGLRKRLLKQPLDFFRALRGHLQTNRDTSPDSLDRLAAASFDLGKLTDEIGDKQDALIAYRESLAIRRKLADANPNVADFQAELAANHNNIGLLLSDTGKPAEAMKEFEKALAIRQKLADAHPDFDYQVELAGTHNNLGVLLDTMGQPVEALKEYESALVIRRRLADADPAATKFQAGLAASHYNIGLLLSVTGKPAKALEEYEKGLAIRQKLADSHPDVDAFRGDLAASHNNIGVLLRDTGKPAEALRAYESALAIQRKLADTHPAVSKFQHVLATTHSNIGLVLKSVGRSAEALRAYESALAIQRKLADANPDVTRFQSDMAISYTNIAAFYYGIKKPAEALLASESALAIRRKLADANPNVPALQSVLATTYGNIGVLLTIVGKPAEAKKSYESSLAILQEQASKHLEMPEFAGELGGTLNNLALIDLNAKRFEEARVRFRQAIEWQRKALASNPAHPTYRKFLDNQLGNLIQTARGLGDSAGVSAAERELAELRDSDPVIVALDARLAAIIKGDQQPSDGAERLRLAQRAYDKSLHATAARFWAQALAADPALGDDRQAQHRYNAACAAVMAASGRGKEASPPDEAAGARLRAQALEWLKAEVAAWRQVAMTGSPGSKETVTETLTHWKADAELAGIRDTQELAKLSGQERSALEQLWTDVAALLTEVRNRE